MSYQLPFMRSIKALTRPKGIAMRPRPAAGIAHMGRPRSPIRLADGGSTGDGSSSASSIPTWLNLGLGALAGAAGSAAFNYSNNGRPIPISNKPQNNPFAIPMIDRSVDPITQVVTQHILGYNAWPGSNAPTSGATGMFANYAPGVNTGGSPSQVAFSSPVAASSQASARFDPSYHYAKGGTVRRAMGGPMPGGPMPQMGSPEQGKNKAIFMAAVQALMGQSPDPQQALKAFVAHWGPQALQELQQHIQGQQAAQKQPQQAPPQQPGMQQGMRPQAPQGITGPVQGPGDGQSDNVPALLSADEHVVPADAVAALGNGSSAAGHRKLQAGIAAVRQKAYGRKQQTNKLRANSNPILGQ